MDGLTRALIRGAVHEYLRATPAGNETHRLDSHYFGDWLSRERPDIADALSRVSEEAIDRHLVSTAADLDSGGGQPAGQAQR